MTPNQPRCHLAWPMMGFRAPIPSGLLAALRLAANEAVAIEVVAQPHGATQIVTPVVRRQEGIRDLARTERCHAGWKNHGSWMFFVCSLHSMTWVLTWVHVRDCSVPFGFFNSCNLPDATCSKSSIRFSKHQATGHHRWHQRETNHQVPKRTNRDQSTRPLVHVANRSAPLSSNSPRRSPLKHVAKSSTWPA